MANREDLVAEIKRNLVADGIVNPTTKEVEKALDAVLVSIKNVAFKSETGVRTSIGTFKRKDRAAHEARNPKTGKPVAVPAKSTLEFSLSKSLVQVHAEKPKKGKKEKAAK